MVSSKRSIILLSIVLLFSSFNFVSPVPYSCDPSISCGCSASSTIINSRIVGGETAPNHAWGWAVSFRLYGIHICGASLISSEYAITAAHCVYNFTKEVSSFSILAGTNYVYNTNDKTVQRRSVTSIIINPNYADGPTTSDIAIIKFPALATTSEYNLAFICLPNANEDPFQIGTNLVAVGWGFLASDNKQLSNELQQVTLQVGSSTSTACTDGGLTDSYSQFCAGVIAGGKDTCQGDSGGPLMAFVNNTWVLAGLTSGGEGCALPNYLGVYTRVSSFVSFIDATIDSLASQTTTSTVTATTTKQNSSESVIIKNKKSIFIMLLCFLFLTCLFSFY